MNVVEPIRDPKTVEGIALYLKQKNPRNHLLLLFWIYSGLRISDILKFRVSAVKHKRYLNIRAQKTGKQMMMEINPVLKKAITDYIEDKHPNEFLFKSREGINKAITRSMAYKIINDVAGLFDLENIGCHTLRKTFGYHYYKQSGGDVVTLMEIFGHTHPAITLRYIGINQEKINNSIRKFRIF